MRHIGEKKERKMLVLLGRKYLYYKRAKLTFVRFVFFFFQEPFLNIGQWTFFGVIERI